MQTEVVDEPNRFGDDDPIGTGHDRDTGVLGLQVLVDGLLARLTNFGVQRVGGGGPGSPMTTRGPPAGPRPSRRRRPSGSS